MKSCGIALAVAMALLSLGCEAKPPAPEAGTLTIRVDRLSRVEVGVLTPSKKFLFLRSGDFSCQGLAIKDAVLTIDPASATGYHWNPEGVRSEVAAFSEVGGYTVYVGEELEAEMDGIVSTTLRITSKQRVAFPTAGTCKGI